METDVICMNGNSVLRHESCSSTESSESVVENGRM